MRHQSNAPNQPAADRQSMRYANGRTKRIFDLGTGVVLSIVTAPIILLLVVGSAVSFRAWPLFVQDRLGWGGDSFTFIKGRSLPTSTPPGADKYAIAHATNNRWGRILRGSHLDELPQCWLVPWRMSSPLEAELDASANKVEAPLISPTKSGIHCVAPSTAVDVNELFAAWLSLRAASRCDSKSVLPDLVAALDK